MIEVKSSRRYLGIDLMKTLLVCGMIWGHVCMLCGESGNKIMFIFGLYINWVTFSGFFFIFGFLYYHVYFSKSREKSRTSLFKNCLKLLIYYYLSAFCFTLLCTHTDMTIQEFCKIIFLWRIPGYSEFLLSFLCVTIIALLFYDSITKMFNVGLLQYGGVMLSLLATYIPYGLIPIPQLGAFIGCEKFSCFPVLQYMSYFIFGAIVTRQMKQVGIITFLLSLLGIGLIVYNHELPQRFPPDLVWICSSQFAVWGYYAICSKVRSMPNVMIGFITLVGKHTIDYLLISNLIIFYMYYMQGNEVMSKLSFISSIGIGMVIIGFITIVLLLIKNKTFNLFISK